MIVRFIWLIDVRAEQLRQTGIYVRIFVTVTITFVVAVSVPEIVGHQQGQIVPYVHGYIRRLHQQVRIFVLHLQGHERGHLVLVAQRAPRTVQRGQARIGVLKNRKRYVKTKRN